MAERCNSTTELEVHHKNRTAGRDLGNAEVLCHDCHTNTASYGVPGESPPEFSVETKLLAKENAGNKCECTRDNCH